jgi:2-keto-3-deoxy-L-rhamnonate aldolase RhmA
MRKNRLREKLAEGRTLTGFLPHVPTPEFVEYCGLLGFDWVFIDGEHGGVSPHRCADLVRAADAVGIASIARVPHNEAAVILPYLETGVAGVIAPHVSDATDARRLVEACRYSPLGARGSSAGSRAANYGLTQTAAEYFAASHEHPLPIPLVEDRHGFERLAEIAAVPEIELVYLGPGDLAMSMGLPGQSTNPEVVQAMETAIALMVRSRKLVGTLATSGADAARLAGMGVTLVVVGTGGLFAAAGRDFLAAARARPPT